MSVIVNASTSTGLGITSDNSGSIVLQNNGSTKLTVDSTGSYGTVTSGTAQNTTSGTSIDFTGIPSWVKKITVMFNGVSTNGTSPIIVQIGSGSVDTTGYFSYGSRLAAAALATTFITSGITCINLAVNTDTVYGSVILTTLGSNIWTSTGSMYLSSTNANSTGGGKTLSNTLDRIRITTVNGIDTFDAGSINILYEG